MILTRNVMAIDSRGSLVYQDTEEEPGRTIAVLGVTDMIIVDMGDALLVCPRDRAEEIRRIVDRLENEGKRDLL
jgi:mannose-1-phosphate guanylyltransferase